MGLFDDMHRHKIEETYALARLAEAQAREHAAREAEGAFAADTLLEVLASS